MWLRFFILPIGTSIINLVHRILKKDLLKCHRISLCGLSILVTRSFRSVSFRLLIGSSFFWICGLNGLNRLVTLATHLRIVFASDINYLVNGAKAIINKKRRNGLRNSDSASSFRESQIANRQRGRISSGICSSCKWNLDQKLEYKV